MRMVNYEAVTAEGKNFYTSNYKEATRNGNHIIRTFLTELDTRTEKEKEATRKRAEKFREKEKKRF